jgi:hypothetical protein
MNRTPIGKIDKGWGYELIWANEQGYCGKLLVFEKPGSKTSMMFHKERSKSWFVNYGKFKITVCDVHLGLLKEAILDEGKTVDISELGPHKLEALVPNSTILEVGTADYENDKFRISPGDSQKPLIEQKLNQTP